MDLGIDGRRAAVAAGSAGLGLGTARALMADGVAVAICGRDRARLEGAVDELGAGAVGVEADLSNPDEARRFAREAAERLGGRLDIVVANAGGPPPGSASTTDLDGYRTAFELNCLSSIALCNEAVGPMREAGWGRIVAITSIGARQPIPYLAASTTARAAVTAYVKTLAFEVAGDGVTVNTVQPGSHDTDRIRGFGPDYATRAATEIPVGHLGDPDDFGAVVAFLCSRQAAFVTGASIIVDGGASGGLQ
jgi:3-oxoacyl-[acyl-carrier protein] reductase